LVYGFRAPGMLAFIEMQFYKLTWNVTGAPVLVVSERERVASVRVAFVISRLLQQFGEPIATPCDPPRAWFKKYPQ
jgi:hypothetical protein